MRAMLSANNAGKITLRDAFMLVYDGILSLWRK